MNSRRGGIAAEHDAIPAAGEAGVLHAGVVLIGEEVRQPVVGLGVTEHVAGGNRPLMQRVRPVLDTDRLAVEAVVRVGDVAGGEHTGRGGVQALVDSNPVVDHQPGVGRDSNAGLYPDSNDHDVALERTPVSGPYALDHALAFEGDHARAGQHPHAMIDVDVAVDAADFDSEHRLERNRVGVDDGDVESALTRGRGHLGADPARPDHDDGAAALQACAEHVGILNAAQVEHTLEVGARDRQPPRLGPSREQEPVVAEPLAVIEHQLVDRGV